jgi:two-component system chemotaxis response regulator CheB
MGKDGAAGMLTLSRAGALTLGESEQTCVVYGMSRAAVELNAVKELLPLSQIGPRIKHLIKHKD